MSVSPPICTGQCRKCRGQRTVGLEYLIARSLKRTHLILEALNAAAEVIVEITDPLPEEKLAVSLTLQRYLKAMDAYGEFEGGRVPEGLRSPERGE